MLISTHAATAPLYNLIRGNGGNGRHQSFARVLSIAIILISLAPLASLYLLLFSLGLGSTTGDGDATVVALPHHDPVHAPAAQEQHQQQQHPYGAFYALTHNTHSPASSDKPTTTHRKRDTGHKEDTTGVSATAATLEQMWSQALFVGSTPQLLHAAAAAAVSSASLLSNEDDDHNNKTKKREAKNASSTTTTTTTSPLLASLLATRTYFPGKVQTIHHLSVVLPWLLTFMLGVCVPAALSLYSFWRQYQNRHLQPPSQPTSSKRQRRSHIQKRLAPYSQTLTRHDRIQRQQPSSNHPASPQSLPPSRDDPSDASSCSDDDDLLFAAVKDCANDSLVDQKKQKRSDKDEERLTLRTCGWRYCPSATTTTDTTTDPKKEAKSLPAAPAPRTIPNTCAICLHSYRVGDVVCGSPNPACIHAFHASCISSWLVTRQQQGRGECPCCRQSYLFAASCGGGDTATTTTTT